MAPVYSRIRLEDRLRIFKAHEDGEDWRAVARTLQVKEPTAYKWLLKRQAEPKKRRLCYKKTAGHHGGVGACNRAKPVYNFEGP